MTSIFTVHQSIYSFNQSIITTLYQFILTTTLYQFFLITTLYQFILTITFIFTTLYLRK